MGRQPRTKQLVFHIHIAAVILHVRIVVELEEQHRLALIIDVPADAGIVRDQHGTLHHDLVERNTSERDHFDHIAADVELTQIIPEFRVDVEDQFDVLLGDVIRQFPALQELAVLPEVIAGAEFFFSLFLQPRPPSRHEQNDLFFRTGLVLQNIPSGESGDRSPFRRITKILRDDILFVFGCRREVGHRAGPVHAEDRIHFLQGRHAVLQEEDLFLPHGVGNAVRFRSPCIEMALGIGADVDLRRQVVDHVPQAHVRYGVPAVDRHFIPVRRVLIHDVIDVAVLRGRQLLHAVTEEIVPVILGHAAEFLEDEPDLFLLPVRPSQLADEDRDHLFDAVRRCIIRRLFPMGEGQFSLESDVREQDVFAQIALHIPREQHLSLQTRESDEQILQTICVSGKYVDVPECPVQFPSRQIQPGVHDPVAVLFLDRKVERIDDFLHVAPVTQRYGFDFPHALREAHLDMHFRSLRFQLQDLAVHGAFRIAFDLQIPEEPPPVPGGQDLGVAIPSPVDQCLVIRFWSGLRYENILERIAVILQHVLAELLVETVFEEHDDIPFRIHLTGDFIEIFRFKQIRIFRDTPFPLPVPEIIFHGKICFVPVQQEVNHFICRIDPIIPQEHVRIIRIVLVRALPVVTVYDAPLQLFDRVDLQERQLPYINVHAPVGHVFVIVVRKEKDRFACDGIIEEYTGIIRDQHIDAVQELVFVDPLRERFDVPVVPEFHVLLNDRMEIHVQFFPIAQHRVQPFQDPGDFRVVLFFFDVLIALSSPCRHIGKRRVRFIAEFLLELSARPRVLEDAVARITAHHDLAGVDIFQIVIAHDRGLRKLIREQEPVGLDEIVLHVIHSLDVVRHQFAQRLQGRPVPGLQIALSVPADEIRWEGAVVHQKAAGR